jgi:RimJ/RimL family protein N-acetyltransferase
MPISKQLFESHRLLFRALVPSDAQLLWELDADPEVMRHISRGEATPLRMIQTEVLPRWLELYQVYEDLGYWAAHEKERGEFVGWFHLKPYLNRLDELELGYRLHQRFWKLGYATEGARVLIERAFERAETERVVATTLEANLPSRRVLQRAGLRKDVKFHYDESLLPGWSVEERRAVRYVLDRARYEREQLKYLEAGILERTGRSSDEEH